MIGATPPRFSVLVKFSAQSNAARIDPTAKKPTIGAVPGQQASASATRGRPDPVLGGRVYVVQPELWLQMRAVADGINRAVQYDALRRPVDGDNRNPALGRCI